MKSACHLIQIESQIVEGWWLHGVSDLLLCRRVEVRMKSEGMTIVLAWIFQPHRVSSLLQASVEYQIENVLLYLRFTVASSCCDEYG